MEAETAVTQPQAKEYPGPQKLEEVGTVYRSHKGKEPVDALLLDIWLPEL